MAFFDKERLPKKNKPEGAFKKPTIMIVDDEKAHLDAMVYLLNEDGYHIITAENGIEALKHIQNMEQPQNISLIISDKRMSGLSGIQLFEKLKDEIPNTIRIILTAYDDKEDIIEAINKAKIHEFILKPFEPEDLKIKVKRAVETFELKREVEEYRRQLELTVDKRTQELKETRAHLIETEKVADRLKQSFFSDGPQYPEYFKGIITKSQKMADIFKYIEAIAEFNSPVLITGETGTGKELIARAIHFIYNTANKKKGNFVADNVAGWNEHLFSDTLYGHEKGAFTDAVKKREGLLKQAENGTLFLDEIGDLELPLQTKLLRLIQEKQYFPLGADQPQGTDARFIFATNKDLNDLKEKGKFRTDLFFRLNTHHIHLPPLRERREDISQLVVYFLNEAAKEYNKEIPCISDQLIALLFNYDFPGNIRELRSMVFEAVSLHRPGEQELSLDVFIKKIREQGRQIDIPITLSKGIIFSDSLPTFEEMKRIYTNEVLQRANNNQTKAAEKAGLDRSTFIRYWKEA
ncbi:MAG: sigma-54 dependent transcriptional regulator [Acidobacteria bacterium]|jgi:DNA-binding NtrC family response regulator|nr:sigma-54 dependent transcriptional regulator [Acidobacteriota bacterium]